MLFNMSYSPQNLLPVDDLIAQLLSSAQLSALNSESCSLNAALGRVLSESIISEMDVPPFDNSAMDGYALAWHPDLQDQIVTVSHTNFAGQAPVEFISGSAVRILTGAPIPRGVDTVIMQENVTRGVSADAVTIQINQQPEQGDNIRRAGQDIAKGQLVFPVGTRLGAAEIGLLASLGVSSVLVYQVLKVSIIATGDELVDVGQPLLKGQIYNSNAPLLAALLKSLQVKLIRVEHVLDQPEQLLEMLSLAALDSDLILTTGGASVGDADHLKSVLTQIGQIENWKIAIKPGKPLVWGAVRTERGLVPLVGLPGNPQSVWVTFLIIVMPYLKALQGQRVRLLPQSVKVPAGFTRSKGQGRREYLRVRLVDGQLIPHPTQSSGALMSASWADGFAVVEVGQTFGVGDFVTYLPMTSVLGV
jgi:molybdopterin molybdotransferase